MTDLLYKWILIASVFLFSNLMLAQTQVISNPVVAQPIKIGISQPLRDLPVTSQTSVENWVDGIIPLRTPLENTAFESEIKKDGSLSNYLGTYSTSEITQNFDGVGAKGYAPPDPSGDVGPNHYVQMVNVRSQIWDKSGNSLVGPFDNINFWSGLIGPWSETNDGDPIVLYDESADRWMVSQFALPNYPSGPFYILIAVSTTPDPTGTYYQYAYLFPDMPDYPKFGIWSDGYYMSSNVFASNYLGTYAAVFDRNEMLTGGVATMQYFSLPSTTWSFLPSDCDGALPPVGSPNYFLATYTPYNAGNSDLDIYEFHVDWTTPANSSFTGPLLLSTPLFSRPDAIPQLGTGTKLDNLADRPMNRLQYRNFGDHEAMVVCQTVNAGSGVAGIRWWEMQKTTGDWSIYQEGTYAPPDGLYRWMGSIALDDSSNIALGYSVSSSTIYPDIRYTGRFASDPLGMMTIVENLIYAGGGSQTQGLTRWGDYTQISVDPTNKGIFWYTNEYIPTDGSFNWKTRIAAFKFDISCPVGFPENPGPDDGANEISINVPQITWTNGTDANKTSLYFGIDPANMSLIQSGSLFTSWDIAPLPLDYSTTYYWKVVNENDTCSSSGSIWSFVTEQDPNIFCWEDNFESGSGNWTITNDGGTCVFEVVPITQNGYSLPPAAAGSVLSADADFCGDGTTLLSTATITAPFDFSTYANVFIEFDNDWQAYTSSDYSYVQVSTDGTNWITVKTFDITNVRSTHEVINISSVAALQPTVYVRLKTVQPGYDYWWVVDNFKVCALDVIPVELTSFSANVSGTSVYLNWKTATELNNSGFEVERKSENGNYVKVGFVAGSGTTSETKVYSYTENNLAAGNYTYRLKQVDFNGSFEYSNEVNLGVNAPLTYNLDQNYPNPFNPSTVIKYSVAKDGFVNVSVFNLLGEKVATLVNSDMKAGSYDVNFNASSLSSGIYFYSINAGDFKAVKKMLLMK